MSQDTIKALKMYPKLFENKGLCRIFSENVTVAEMEIMAIWLQLNEVGVLPYETVIDAFTDPTIYSITDFVKLFNFLLQQAKVKAQH